jgi:hypothetical protein
MPDSSPNHAPLRVAGFGACMMNGYPHKNGGFFNIACTRVAEDLACSVESKIFSFGGFPVPRVEKYLEPKIIGYAPNFVIIQFASLDALCPVRRARLGKTDSRNAQVKPANPWSWLRWELASLLGYLRRLEPTTPLPVYLPIMERMIDSCIAAEVTPIVLTPFVYGSRYSMRSGVIYANALRELIANKPGAILVDCIEALRAYPKDTVLQHDGFHLSQNGHAAVGLAIAQQITSHLRNGRYFGRQHSGVDLLRRE